MNNVSDLITPSEPRRTARVTMLSDGSIWSGPIGTPLEKVEQLATRARARLSAEK